MVEAKIMNTEDFDSLKSGCAKGASGKCRVGRIENDRLEVVADFNDEGESEVAARALAEHMGGTYLSYSSKRIIKFTRELYLK